MFKILYIFFFALVVSNCSFKKVVKHHGIPFLEKKQKQLIIDQSTSNDIRKIEKILSYFNLSQFKFKYPNQLSNGQKQRVCVARSLVNSPKLLIADEPTSYLDKENANLVIDLILNSSKKFNLSTIIASHDISFRPLFDKSYTIDDKSIKEC